MLNRSIKIMILNDSKWKYTGTLRPVFLRSVIPSLVFLEFEDTLRLRTKCFDLGVRALKHLKVKVPPLLLVTLASTSLVRILAVD